MKQGTKIQTEILGKKQEGNLYLIFWQRLVNSGIIICYAKNEYDAINKYGYNPQLVMHTIAKIDKLPVQYGEVN